MRHPGGVVEELHPGSETIQSDRGTGHENTISRQLTANVLLGENLNVLPFGSFIVTKSCILASRASFRQRCSLQRPFIFCLKLLYLIGQPFILSSCLLLCG